MFFYVNTFFFLHLSGQAASCFNAVSKVLSHPEPNIMYATEMAPCFESSGSSVFVQLELLVRLHRKLFIFLSHENTYGIRHPKKMDLLLKTKSLFGTVESEEEHYHVDTCMEQHLSAVFERNCDGFKGEL